LTSQQTFLRKVIFDFQFGVQYQETASVHGVMVFVLASSVVDRGFELRLYQTRDLIWYSLLLCQTRGIKE